MSIPLVVAAAVALLIGASQATIDPAWPEGPPPNGAAPDARTAIAIASAVFNGADARGRKLGSDGDGLLVAELQTGKNPYWIVQDKIDCPVTKDHGPCAGGLVIIIIRKRDGAVLDYFPLE